MWRASTAAAAAAAILVDVIQRNRITFSFSFSMSSVDRIDCVCSSLVRPKNVRHKKASVLLDGGVYPTTHNVHFDKFHPPYLHLVPCSLSSSLSLFVSCFHFLSSFLLVPLLNRTFRDDFVSVWMTLYHICYCYTVNVDDAWLWL